MSPDGVALLLEGPVIGAGWGLPLPLISIWALGFPFNCSEVNKSSAFGLAESLNPEGTVT